jgi:TonB family protein
VIVDKIHTVESTNFDTSVKGLTALKTGNVSDLVIRAMINPRFTKSTGNGTALGRAEKKSQVMGAISPAGQVVPISHTEAQALLLKKIAPTYPALARTARVQGNVDLKVTIGAEGAVEKAEAVTGHPLLIPAAIEAVSQWVFKPYVLKGNPVRVETQVTILFTLGGNTPPGPLAPAVSASSPPVNKESRVCRATGKGEFVCTPNGSTISPGLNMTEVHGHILGERLGDYIARSPDLQRELSDCRQVIKKKRPTLPPHVYSWGYQDKYDQQNYWDHCNTLIAGVDASARVSLNSGGYVKPMQRIKPADQLSYDNGVLVRIETITNAMRVNPMNKLPPQWDDVVTEMTNRFGQPTGHADRITENGYGAIFHHRSAIWETALFYAKVYESDPSIGDPENTIVVETPEEHRRTTAEQAGSKASALD